MKYIYKVVALVKLPSEVKHTKEEFTIVTREKGPAAIRVVLNKLYGHAFDIHSIDSFELKA